MNISFSYGERKCPGQAFALLELKVALTYLLTHYDFDVPQEFLNRNNTGFAICTEEDIEMTIRSITI